MGLLEHGREESLRLTLLSWLVHFDHTLSQVCHQISAGTLGRPLRMASRREATAAVARVAAHLVDGSRELGDRLDAREQAAEELYGSELFAELLGGCDGVYRNLLRLFRTSERTDGMTA